MNPNHMNWRHVTLLHDMARKNDLRKAQLLLGCTKSKLKISRAIPDQFDFRRG